MNSLHWLVIGLAALLVALHPFVTYPLSLLLWCRLRRRTEAPAKWSRPLARNRFALCTYVRDDAGSVAARLEALVALTRRRSDAELLVFVDRCATHTIESLQQHAGALQVVVGDRMRGKARAMNALVARTRADVIVFVDDGVSPDAALFDSLDEHFSDRSIGCVCGNPVVGSATKVESAYRRFERWLKRLETQTGSTMGADGTLFAVRATLHHPPPDGVLHDMWVSMMVLCSGHRVVHADDVRAHGEPTPAKRLAFEPKRRTAFEGLRVHRLLWPLLRRSGGLLVYQYVSHKLLRWFSVYLVAAALVCFAMAALLAGDEWTLAATLASIAALLLWTLARRRRPRPLREAVAALGALCGAGVGAWWAIRDKRR
jgi:hypothetical protein